MWGVHAQNLTTRHSGQRLLHLKHVHACAIRREYTVKRVNLSIDNERYILTAKLAIV